MSEIEKTSLIYSFEDEKIKTLYLVDKVDPSNCIPNGAINARFLKKDELTFKYPELEEAYRYVQGEIKISNEAVKNLLLQKAIKSFKENLVNLVLGYFYAQFTKNEKKMEDILLLCEESKAKIRGLSEITAKGYDDYELIDQMLKLSDIPYFSLEV